MYFASGAPVLHMYMRASNFTHVKYPLVPCSISCLIRRQCIQRALKHKDTITCRTSLRGASRKHQEKKQETLADRTKLAPAKPRPAHRLDLLESVIPKCCVREYSQPCLHQDVASKYHAFHIIYCINQWGDEG